MSDLIIGIFIGVVAVLFGLLPLTIPGMLERRRRAKLAKDAPAPATIPHADELLQSAQFTDAEYRERFERIKVALAKFVTKSKSELANGETLNYLAAVRMADYRSFAFWQQHGSHLVELLAHNGYVAEIVISGGCLYLKISLAKKEGSVTR